MTPGNGNSTSQIIKPEHLPMLNSGLDTARILQRELDLAKRAGLDTSAQQAKLDATVSTLQKIKNTYFPGQ